MRSGNTISFAGKEILNGPWGIVVCSVTNDLVVEDHSLRDKVVRVFDSNGTHLRTFGRGYLQSPCGVSVDGVGECMSQTVMLMRLWCLMASGTHLKSITVEGKPV